MRQINACLCELYEHGAFVRFALTPNELKECYPSAYTAYEVLLQREKQLGLRIEHFSVALGSDVILGIAPCIVADAKWKRFFADMSYDLPDWARKEHVVASIRVKGFQSLLPFAVPYLKMDLEKYLDDLCYAIEGSEEKMIDLGFTQLLVEELDGDDAMKGVQIGMRDCQGDYQDVALIRGKNNNRVSCYVWSDPCSDDYTQRFDIKPYDANKK